VSRRRKHATIPAVESETSFCDSWQPADKNYRPIARQTPAHIRGRLMKEHQKKRALQFKPRRAEKVRRIFEIFAILELLTKKGRSTA
jgi:hypothetical protein